MEGAQADRKGPFPTRPTPSPPTPLPTEVVRTRLLGRLDDRFERPVTTVVAGAGFGKTTLLAQAVRRNLAAPRGIDAWVSCQPGDEDPVRFSAACLNALAGAAGGPEPTTIAEAMRRWSPADVCLMVDDAHELAGLPAEALLAELVRTLPANGHLVLAGRTPVAVRLARLRAAGRCLDLEEVDLAFTPAEEQELASLLQAKAVGPGLAGWPALVRLALTSQPGAPHEFLWEEVVGGLAPELARALLGLAIIGWADTPTLQAICGIEVDVDRLVASVPLTTLSDGGIVRAHDLWTGMVDRLFERARIAELLPAVCLALEGRGDPARLTMIASRFGDLATVRHAARVLVGQTVASLPVRLAEALLTAAGPGPAGGDEADEAPELLLLRAAVAHARSVDDPRVDPLVARARAGFAAGGDEVGESVALLLAGQVASSRGAYNQFLEIALRVAELPGARENVSLHAISQLVTATLAEMNGDLAAALDAMASLPPPETDHPMKEPVARLLVYLLVLSGRADEATGPADVVLRQSRHAQVRATAPFVHWSAGDPRELEALQAGVGPAVDTNARDRFFHAVLSSLVHASTGDLDRLEALADQLRAINPSPADVRDASMLAVAEAVRLVAAHDEAGAVRALAAHLERHPVDDPRCDIHLRRALATVYVCVPQVRHRWDDARLGPCHRRMLAAARALLAARSDDGVGPGVGTDPARTVDTVLAETDALITMVPLPWAVELSVRAHAAGRMTGALAAERLHRRVGPAVGAELSWQASHGDPALRAAARELADRPFGLSARIRIEVLGPARVLIDGDPTAGAVLRRARVRQLLSLLVVEPHVLRERAMILLWPDLDAGAGARNLRVTLSYLRRLFRLPDAAGGPGTLDEQILQVDNATIRLRPHPALEVDLWELDAALAAGPAGSPVPGAPADRAASVEAVTRLWRGEPLPDLADVPELGGEVTRVRAALLDGVLTLGELRLTEGRASDAVGAAAAVLAADPYVERAHRLAIAAQIHLGDLGAARAAVERLDRDLGEVGADPTAMTQMLLRRVASLTGAGAG